MRILTEFYNGWRKDECQFVLFNFGFGIEKDPGFIVSVGILGIAIEIFISW